MIRSACVKNLVVALHAFLLCLFPRLAAPDERQAAAVAPGTQTQGSESISALSQRRPCASLVLLWLRRAGPEPTGVLYYAGYPTPQTVMLTMQHADTMRIRQSLRFLHFNPYSPDGPGVVGVHWTLHSIGDDTLLVSFEAEILDKSGRPLAPRHFVEPRTFALVSRGSFRILQVFDRESTTWD